MLQLPQAAADRLSALIAVATHALERLPLPFPGEGGQTKNGINTRRRRQYLEAAAAHEPAPDCVQPANAAAAREPATDSGQPASAPPAWRSSALAASARLLAWCKTIHGSYFYLLDRVLVPMCLFGIASSGTQPSWLGAGVFNALLGMAECCLAACLLRTFSSESVPAIRTAGMLAALYCWVGLQGAPALAAIGLLGQQVAAAWGNRLGFALCVLFEKLLLVGAMLHIFLEKICLFLVTLPLAAACSTLQSRLCCKALTNVAEHLQPGQVEAEQQEHAGGRHLRCRVGRLHWT